MTSESKKPETTTPEPSGGQKSEDTRLFHRINPAGSQKKLYLNTGFQEFNLLNISKGGVYFLSDHKYGVGERLQVNFFKMFQQEVEILHHEMIMVDEVFLEVKYKTGARFVPGPLEDDVFAQIMSVFGVPDSSDPPPFPK
ncbi:MAG: hypothetical protein OEW12_03415 [Deltaproteobacteria bacterium]|nr:hypothetical protein [Deltaproteobacteria bacterium]